MAEPSSWVYLGRLAGLAGLAGWLAPRFPAKGTQGPQGHTCEARQTGTVYPPSSNHLEFLTWPSMYGILASLGRPASLA